MPAAASRRNPKIVKIMELGLSRTGPFLVMELVRGRTLYEVLKQEEVFTPLRTAHIARQLAEGLEAAHRAGYVHRDLKPSNIMLIPSEVGEQVKVLDLGIVRIHDRVSEQLTAENLVLGTPAYMAPEQFHNSHVGPSADLYALGVLIFEMLVGHAPFGGTFREIIAQHMATAPGRVPYADGLGDIALRLLSKKVEARPKDARAVIESIDQIFPRSLFTLTAAFAPVKPTVVSSAVPISAPMDETAPMSIQVSVDDSAITEVIDPASI